MLLAFVAGFLAGDGIAYYLQGSTGYRDHPLPLRKSPAVNVVIGWVLLVLAATAGWFAHLSDHPLAGCIAAAVGVLVVGLVHARIWPGPQRSARVAGRTWRR